MTVADFSHIYSVFSSFSYWHSESLDLGWLQFFDLHVQCFVDSQSPGLTEALSTLLTLEGLFFGMNIPAGGISNNRLLIFSNFKTSLFVVNGHARLYDLHKMSSKQSKKKKSTCTSILNFSRLYPGKLHVRTQVFNIYNFVKTTLS